MLPRRSRIHVGDAGTYRVIISLGGPYRINSRMWINIKVGDEHQRGSFPVSVRGSATANELIKFNRIHRGGRTLTFFGNRLAIRGIHRMAEEN